MEVVGIVFFYGFFLYSSGGVSIFGNYLCVIVEMIENVLSILDRGFCSLLV